MLELSRSASGSEVPGGFIQLNPFKQACAMTVAIIIAAIVLATYDISDVDVTILQM